MAELSTLAMQRAEDAVLCAYLRDAVGFDGRRLLLSEKGADRIESLSAQLAEASHDRDRFHADLQRMKEAANG